MKKIYLRSTIFFAMISVLSISCREDFDPNFGEVSIVNNAPEYDDIGEIFFGLPDEVGEIEMANFVSDTDGDPLAFVASSSDESVVTLEVAGSRLDFTFISLGSSTITFTASDGQANEQGVANQVSGSFIVTILEEAPEDED